MANNAGIEALLLGIICIGVLIAALAVPIVAIVLPLVHLPLGILALVLGGIGYWGKKQHNNYALTGLILGIATLVIGLVMDYMIYNAMP